MKNEVPLTQDQFAHSVRRDYQVAIYSMQQTLSSKVVFDEIVEGLYARYLNDFNKAQLAAQQVEISREPDWVAKAEGGSNGVRS